MNAANSLYLLRYEKQALVSRSDIVCLSYPHRAFSKSPRPSYHIYSQAVCH